MDEPILKDGKFADGSSGIVYYSANAQYSIGSLTDANGNVVERYAYDAYGNVTFFNGNSAIIATSAYNNPYTYTARRTDAESGLMYFRARMYDTDLGRFISRDPLGFVDGMSLYRGYFVPGDVDPTGKKYASCVIAVACLARIEAACLITCARNPIWDKSCDTRADCFFKCRKSQLEGALKGVSDAACYAAAYACGGRILNQWAKATGKNVLPKPVMGQGPQGPVRGY